MVKIQPDMSIHTNAGVDSGSTPTTSTQTTVQLTSNTTTSKVDTVDISHEPTPPDVAAYRRQLYELDVGEVTQYKNIAAAKELEQTKVKDSNPPKKGEDLSNDKKPLEEDFLKPYVEHAKRTVKNQDGTFYTYDDKGYVREIRDKNDNLTRNIIRNPDGSVEEYWDYKYDEAGNKTRQILRATDGSVKEYKDYEYDRAGNETRQIIRNPDGSVIHYSDYEYDEAGHMTRHINQDADGSKTHWEFIYDEAGHMTREMWRATDGSVNVCWDFIYDGNRKRTTLKHDVKNNKYYINIEEVSKEEYDAAKAKANEAPSVNEVLPEQQQKMNAGLYWAQQMAEEGKSPTDIANALEKGGRTRDAIKQIFNKLGLQLPEGYSE